MRGLAAAAALIAALVASPVSWGGASGPLEPFPITGAYQAFFREDREGVTVIDFAGNYNKQLPNGSANVEPRAVIAREFLRTHPDEYDFIVTFSTFEFETPDALAFHWNVQNRVQGIGLTQFDTSSLFGSQGKLQGYTDMAAMSRYVLDPMDPGFETVLRTLAHETLHQWGSFARFRNASGQLDEALLGKDNAHWSYLLDTDASVQYGAQWRDNGDGTFTSVGARTFFSPLDLYLMGFYKPEEVPPFFLIENAQIDKYQITPENVTITGTRREVTIQDVIAAEGPRVPAAAQAQKEFRMAFVLLAGPGEDVSDAQIASLNDVRNAFMTRFSIMTGGRAVAHVYPQARSDASSGTPDVVEGDGPRTAPASVEEALVWLRSRQTDAGFWADKDTTTVRDTTVVAGTMATLDSSFLGTQLALQWLNLHPSSNVDSLARHARLVTDLGNDAAAIRTQIVALQNTDGGWGLSAGYQSNPLDTALALSALAGGGSQSAIDRAAQYLLTKQNSDGGWSSSAGSPSRTTPTTTVLRALQAAGRHGTAATAALAWLVSKQNSDGGFGDSPSTVHDTAQAVQTFIAFDAMTQIRGDDATNYILARQSNSGSWEGSVYTTASAVGALRRFSYPNWVLSSIAAVPVGPRDGDRVQFSISVRNDANAVAPASVLRLYDGDPDAGGTQIGADLTIPILPPSGTVTFSPTWDSLNRAGAHAFTAVIDPLNEQAELTKRDNRGVVSVTVEGAPQAADLTFGSPEITVMPSQPNRLPSTLGMSVNVRNLGLTNAANVRVRLWAGEPGSTLVGESTLDVLARTTVVVNFTHMITQPGAVTFTAQVDADNAITEANETNNSATASASTVPSQDLVVTNADISVDKSPAMTGDDVTFTIDLRNEGTSDVPSTQARYLITDGNSTQELRVNTLQLGAGQSTQQTIPWRVDLSGPLTFTAQLDPSGLVPELDEANNVATLSLSAGSPSGPNLAVGFADFIANPNPGREGYALALSAIVRNTGTEGAQNAQVVFYNGDPATGGTQIGTTQTIATLAPGAQTTVQVTWSAVPDSMDKLLFVVLDPANAIAEFSEADNIAFNVVTVLSLPDLALAAGDLQLSPQFPRTGEAAVLSVRVSNLGAQSAADIVVRAFDGDPASGGVQIGANQVVSSIPGFGFASASFNWAGSTAIGDRTLYVQVDPADVVLERNNANNSASRSFSVLDGDLYPTNKYFSPDGDGVRDSTQLTFRLQSTGTVAVEVLNKGGSVVRRFDGATLTNVNGGTVTWDGLDQLGRLVPDGPYTMRVVDGQGTQINSGVVHVDTNRSSLIEAVGTRFASISNLTCELPTVERLEFTGDDATGFFHIPNGRSPDAAYPLGIYSMAGDGTDIRAIVPESFFGTQHVFWAMSAARDGSAVAFSLINNGAGSGLIVASGDGKQRRQIPTADTPNTIIMSPDGRTVYGGYAYSSATAVYAFAADGTGVPRELVPASDNINWMGLSPDGKTLGVITYTAGQSTLWLVDTASGVRVNAFTWQAANSWDEYTIAWSPTSSALLVQDSTNWQFMVIGRDGTLLRTFDMPVPVTEDLVVGLGAPQWSSSGTEFAFPFAIEPESDNGYGNEDLSNFETGGLYVADMVTGEVRKAAPFVSFEPCSGCEEQTESSYHVSTWDGAQWVERGVLHYTRHYQEQKLDLSKHLPDANGEYRVRIRQVGLDMAHVDGVALQVGQRRVEPTTALALKTSADILEQVRRADKEVQDLHEAEMDVRWADVPRMDAKIELALTAREAKRSPEFVPFGYPADGYYDYRVSGDRALVLDGNQTAQDGLGEPLFRVRSKPDTGHPTADVYGYAQSDAEHLYATLDFTVDNTFEEGEKDWASLQVRTAAGEKTFRISSDQLQHGRIGFIRTGKVRYTHRYYEFRIPLADIGAKQGDVVSLSFKAFGEGGGYYSRQNLEGLKPQGDLYWVPGERSLLYRNDYYHWEGRDEDIWAVMLDEDDRTQRLFAERADEWNDLRFSPSGRQLLFNSSEQADDPSSICYNEGASDHWSYRSLLNLTADLRALRSAKAGGIQLRGTASDLNFANYSLDYAPVATPNAWLPVAPAAGQPVVDDFFTTWVPPSPGNYLVRLSVEDLAGNVRRTVKRVSWADTPSITDVHRSPAIISPNGDGVQDASIIHYRVLEPVHLTFEIFNEANGRVRVMTRDHSVTGVEVDVIWDGRDDNGLPVPDGRYRLVLQDYEFTINVDSTPPVALITVRDAYQPLTSRDDSTRAAYSEPGFEWRVADTNLQEQTFEIGAGSEPELWQEYVVPDRETCLAPVETARSPPEAGPWTPRMHLDRTCQTQNTGNFVGQRLRLTAVDTAGNRTIAVTDLPAEQLIITSLGSHEELPCENDSLSQQVPCGPVFRRTGSIAYVPLSDSDGAGTSDERYAISSPFARLGVSETIRAPIVQLAVQYRLIDQPEWSETPVDKYFVVRESSSDTETLDEAPNITQHSLRTTWAAGGLEQNQSYVVRMHAVDAGGGHHYSNTSRIRIQGGLTFKGLVTGREQDPALRALLRSTPSEPGEYTLWGQELIAEPLQSIKLVLKSADDPRYATERVVGEVAYPQAAVIFRTKDLQSCKHYSGYLEARTEPYPDPVTGQLAARVYRHDNTFSIECLEIVSDIEPVSAGVCGAPSPQQIDVTLKVKSLDGTPLTLLTLFQQREDGSEDVLFNVNNPTQSAHKYRLDTSTLPEGTLPLQARLINANDEELVAGVPVIVDRTPPTASFSYPLEGQRVCGVVRQLEGGTTRNEVTLEGVASDANGVHYSVGYQDGAGNGRGSHDSRCYQYEPETNFFKLNSDCQLDPADFHLRPGRTGPLDQFFDYSGEVTARLSVHDWGGFVQCTDRSFYLDAQVEGAQARLDRELFSPNDDDQFDEVTVTYGLDESATLNVAVHATERDPTGALVTVGDSLRTLLQQAAVLPGESSLQWDGRIGGTVAPDGWYGIVLSFRDSCGNVVTKRLFVEIDATAPTINVAYPQTTSVLAMIIEVQGTVLDEHPQSYAVDFGSGSVPDSWVRLAASVGDAPSTRVLGMWNTFGLEGAHVIRVVAIDAVANERVVMVPINLAVRTNLISDLQAQPPLFSPNGDGRVEATAVRFAVEQNVVANLVVLNSGGIVRRTLLNEQSFQRGPRVQPWDGNDDDGEPLPDGVYTVRLAATLATDPLVRQEEQVSVVLDRTPPTISIVRPTGGFVSAAGFVIGSIQDARLASYEVALTDTPQTPAWEVLESGEVSRVDAMLGSLQDRPEGDYVLRVTARDQGEITTSTNVPFTIDSTPPRALITAPATGAVTGERKGTTNISATLEELHLQDYRLRFGAGNVPATWTELATGTTLPLPPVLHSWDVSGLDDGLYTIQLLAQDRAGLSGESRIAVIVDNTPPTVALTVPADQQYVTEAIEIRGTANDANLAEYRIEVAPGARGQASRWSQIGSGTTPVEAGVLATWDALPADGLYTLRLTGIDQADNTNEMLIEITIDTHPPAAPVNLTAVVENRTSARLNWTANAEPDLAGYAVYRDGVKITTTLLTGPTYLDPSLTEARYTYTVTAVDHAGLESERSNEADIVVDTTPPTTRITTPASLSTVSGLFDIIGTAYSGDDFKEYRLYVGAGAAPADFQLMRRSPVPIQGDVLSQWNTVVLAEGAQFTLKLEGEDINGNIATDLVTVTVDNLPPAVPTGLVAVATGADVQLDWNANTEPDLLGYLLFRNDRLANQTGVLVGSLKPYAIATTSYADLALSDGEYSYYLLAIDRAGNMSDPSSAVPVTLDNRAPTAVISHPLTGALFDSPLYVQATSADTDLANIQIQYRPQNTTTWLELGAADTAALYEGTLVPADLGLTHGIYELRAVATDLGGRTDAAPAVISVTYQDVTRPAAVVGVVAQVNGGTVTLSWTANTDADLNGYHIDRENANGTVRLTSAAISGATTFVDIDVPDADYEYVVVAMDTAGNEADPSAPATALVYTPQVAQPYSPTWRTSLDIAGTGRTAAVISGDLVNSSGTSPLPQVATSGENNTFTLSPLTLVNGVNTLTLQLTDAANNVSKPFSAAINVGPRPSQPTGVVAQATGSDVALSWNANPESDIIGYRVLRNDAPRPDDVAVSGLTATASSQSTSSTPPSAVLDSTTWNYWSPLVSVGQPLAGQWLAVTSAAPQLLAGVDIRWSAYYYAASGFAVQGWSGTTWVTLAEVDGNNSSFNEIRFEEPYRTTALRVVLHENGYYGVQMNSIAPYAHSLATGTSFADVASNGVQQYTVSAVNALGFESEPSAPTPQSTVDVQVPGPITLFAAVSGSDVTLTWSIAAGTQLNGFYVYRDNQQLDYIYMSSQVSSYVDRQRPNGTYVYVLDPSNGSSKSNEVSATVAIQDLPAAPLALSVVQVPFGSALDLSWTAPAGEPVSGYRVSRGLIAGGPYQVVGSATSTQLRDSGLTNGTTYYYVVAATDDLGNAGASSNEASGTPADQTPPAATIHAPTVTGKLLATLATTANVVGRTDPGARVDLLRAGVRVRDGIATSTDDAAWAAMGSGNADLSPDGRLLAYEAYQELRLKDMTSGVDIHLTGLSWQAQANPVWTPDGAEIYFADYDSTASSGYLQAYRVADGTVREITAAEDLDIQGFTLSADGSRLAMRVGYDNLSIMDTATGVTTSLTLPTDLRMQGYPMSLSPDGTRLAYVRSSGVYRLVVFHIPSNTATVVETQSDENGAQWSADGGSLVFARESSSGARQIVRYTLADGVATLLTADSYDHSHPVWSPDGAAVAYRVNPGVWSDSTAELVELATGVKRPIASLDGWALPLRWTPSGHLLMESLSNPDWARVTPAGRVEFQGVSLNDGDNVLALAATDAAGNVGAPSQPIVISRGTAPGPDLSVSAADLLIFPGAPLVGESARVSITVHNVGNAPSTSSVASLIMVDPSGAAIELREGVTLNSIAAGGRQTLSMDWQASAPAGAYSLLVIVDPLDQLTERSESNNLAVREFDVISENGQALGVTTDQSDYDAGDQVAATVTLRNYTQSFTGTLEILIEDSEGYLVQSLDARAVAPMSYGATRTEQASWTTGSTFAGSYQVHARLVNASGQVSAEARTPFIVRPSSAFSATVSTDRVIYLANNTVRASGTFLYSDGNESVAGAEAILRIVDGANAVLAETRQTLGDLLPGATGTITLDWNTGTQPLGTYRATLSIGRVETVLATAQAALQIESGSGELAGSMTLSEQAPAPGTPQVISFNVRNLGNTAFTQLPVIVSLLAADSSTAIDSEQTVGDLAVDGQLTGSVMFDTAALLLQTYTVRLQVEIPDDAGTELVTLQTLGFTLADRSPPVVTIQQPLAGALIRGDVAALVRASDSLTTIGSVEINVDGGAWSAALIHDASESVYSSALGNLIDGAHNIAARATDSAGNTGSAAAVSFTVDNTPPQIEVLGAVDAGVYGDDVTLTVTATDTHLASTTTTLNGVPYVSGTLITASGPQQLLVVALDAAGNLTTRELAFTIERGAPVITVTGVEQGGLYNVDVTPIIVVTDTDPTTHTATLNGQPYVSGAMVTADGEYVLHVEAQDSVGNNAALTRQFTIDKTAPSLVITTPTNGATLSVLTTNVSGTTEPLASVYLTVGSFQANGTADANGLYSFTQVPLSQGANVIQAYARDRAGNSGASASVSVTVTTGTGPLLDGVIAAHHGVLVFMPASGDADGGRVEGVRGVRTPESAPPHPSDQYASLFATLEGAFAARGVDYRIVRNGDDFIAALRSRRYDVMVFADLREDPLFYSNVLEPDDASMREIRAAVSGGMGAVWITTRHSENPRLQKLFGAQTNGELSGVTQVTLPEGVASSAGVFNASGNAVELLISGGTRVGDLSPSAAAAISIHQLGDGRTALLAFDPASFTDQQAAHATVANVLAYAEPTQLPVIPGGVVELSWTIPQLQDVTAPQLRVDQLPAGMLLLHAYGGTATGITSATWNLPAGAAQATVSALVRLPILEGTYNVEAALYETSTGTPTQLVQDSVEVAAATGIDEYLAQVRATLDALVVPPSEMPMLEDARWTLSGTMATWPDSWTEDVGTSINKLTTVYQTLEGITPPPHPAMSELGMLLFHFEALYDARSPLVRIKRVDNAFHNEDVVPLIIVIDADPFTQTITLNDQPYVPDTPISADGEYVLMVTATDIYGASQYRKAEFTIDKTPPTVVIAQPLDDSTRTTYATNVSGTTEPSATVFLTVGSFQISTAADATGHYLFTHVPLVDGVNQIQVAARDRAGNDGPTSTANVTVSGATVEQLSTTLVARHGALVWLPAVEAAREQMIEGNKGVRTPASAVLAPDDRYGPLASLLEAVFADRELDYKIVRNEANFLAALRTGRYDMTVFAELAAGGDPESASLLDASPPFVLNEVSALTAAGAGSLWIKTTHQEPDPNGYLHHLYGAHTSAGAVARTQVILPNGPASVAGTWALSGVGAELATTWGGTAVGEMSPGASPAMSIYQLGEGRGALLGFNPAELVDAQAAIDTLSNVLGYITPAPATAIPGSLVEMQWTASNLVAGSDIELHVPVLPEGMTFVAAYGGVLGSTTEATWTLEDVAAAQATFSGLVRLPMTEGTHTIDAGLYRMEDGSPGKVADSAFGVAATSNIDDHGAAVAAALNVLTAEPAQQEALDYAREHFGSALSYPRVDLTDAGTSILFLELVYWEGLRRLDPQPVPELVLIGKQLRYHHGLWMSFAPP